MSIWLFAALAAATAGVLAALQYLRIRPRQVRIITTLFWQQAADQAQARTLLERFRHPRTYLLLLAASLLMLLALARPVFNTAGQPHRVIVLEAGLDMTAAQGGAANSGTTDNRFDNALELVRAEAASLDEDHIAVITADPWPRLLKHFDESMVTLEGRLGQVRAANSPIDREIVLQTAKSLLADRERGEVVLVTAQPAATAEKHVRVLAAGEVLPNAFILSASFIPEQADLTRGTFHFRVGFTGKEAGAVTVEVNRANDTLLQQKISFKPGEVKEFGTVSIAADGTVLTASLNGNDAVDGDNLIEFQLPDRRQILVLPADDLELPHALTSILDSLPGVTTEVARDADLPVVRVGRADSADEGGELMPIRASRHPLVDGLQFEDALCRAPATPIDVADGSLPLLISDGSPVATLNADASQLTISETIFSEDASLVRRMGYLVFWSNMLHHLAGWTDEPLTLSPVQAARSTDATSTALRLKADMSNFNIVASADAAKPDKITSAWLPAWQLLLIAALLLMILEAILNIHGRIS